MTDLMVDGLRLWQNLMAMAEIGTLAKKRPDFGSAWTGSAACSPAGAPG